jgi:hypothetical protein
MATYSTLLRFTKQATGEALNTWGDILSAQQELVDESIAGETAVTTTGGDTTLSTANGATDEARRAMLNISGALTANAAIIVPASTKTYDVFNNTTNSFTLTIKISGGTGVTISQGGSGRVAYNSSSGDVVYVGTPTTSATLANTLAGILTDPLAGATNIGTVDAGTDRIPLYDASGLTTGYITPNQLSFDISGLTAETTLDTANDQLAIYDASAGVSRKFTPQALFNGYLSGTGNIATIDAATDRLPVYDVSGSVTGYTTPAAVLAAAQAALPAETALDLVSDFVRIFDATDTGDNNMTPTNFVNQLFTNVANVVAVDNTNDRVLVYDTSATTFGYASPSQMTFDLNGLTAETVLDLANDKIAVYDTSAAGARSFTPQAFLDAAFSGLANIAAVDPAADFVPIYDASGTTAGYSTPNAIAAAQAAGLATETVLDIAADFMRIYDQTDTADNNMTPQVMFDQSYAQFALLAAVDDVNDKIAIWDATDSIVKYVATSAVGGSTDLTGLVAETVVDPLLDFLMMHDATDVANNSITPNAFHTGYLTAATVVATADVVTGWTTDRYYLNDVSGVTTGYVTPEQMQMYFSQAAVPATTDRVVGATWYDTGNDHIGVLVDAANDTWVDITS